MTGGERGAAPTSHPTSADEQLALIMGEAPTHAPSGRVELGVAAAIAAAKLDAVYQGACALAIECARSIDVAARRADPWAVAAAARELRETLTRLRLDPEAREDDGDAGGLDQLLRDLATPTLGQPTIP